MVQRRIMTCIEVADILRDTPRKSFAKQEAVIRALGNLRVRVMLRADKIRIEYMDGKRLLEIHKGDG